jgi:tocopherol O-methyltransferase
LDLNRLAYEQTNFNTITDYYDIYHKLYLDIWGNNDNLALHVGYYDNNDSKLISHDASIIKMNKFIADKAKIKKSDLILDAGCSVGGSSLWFAKNYGARIIGISLSKKEISLAKKFAKQKSIQNVEFKVMDYHNTEFSSETFDTVLAIESVCYSYDKEKFLDECYRLLKKNGKIIITDYFKADDLVTNLQKKWIDKINRDYTVDLCSMTEFKKYLNKFLYSDLTDITSNVINSYIEGLKKIKNTYLFTKSKEPKKNIAREFDRVNHEFKCIKKNILKYCIVVSQK